jgi:hypothetical protein
MKPQFFPYNRGGQAMAQLSLKKPRGQATVQIYMRSYTIILSKILDCCI